MLKLHQYSEWLLRLRLQHLKQHRRSRGNRLIQLKHMYTLHLWQYWPLVSVGSPPFYRRAHSAQCQEEEVVDPDQDHNKTGLVSACNVRIIDYTSQKMCFLFVISPPSTYGWLKARVGFCQSTRLIRELLLLPCLHPHQYTFTILHRLTY